MHIRHKNNVFYVFFRVLFCFKKISHSVILFDKKYKKILLIIYNNPSPMQAMTSQQSHELMRRFPDIELSYETIPHRKVSTDYDMCLGIPVGKKCLLWYTFYKENDVCILIELTREKKPGNIFFVQTIDCPTVAYGSVFHGTWIDASVGSLGMNSVVHVTAATANSAAILVLNFSI
jgi:hypothetical protein